MEHQFNFKKALKNDFILGGSLLFAVIFLLAPIFLSKVGLLRFRYLTKLPFSLMIATSDFITCFIFSIVIIVALIVFIRRVLYLKSFQMEYKTLDATVAHALYFRDRIGIDVEYELGYQKFTRHFVLFNNKDTNFIQEETVLKLLVKSEDPSHSVILEFYF